MGEGFEAKPAKAPTAAPEPPRAVVPQWGQLVPGHFGLKAGYYPTSDGGKVQFLRIVAWFTLTTRTVDAPLVVQNFFLPVVVAPNGGLTPAVQVGGMRFLGTFPKRTKPDIAWALSTQWRAKPEEAQQQPPALAYPVTFDPKNPPKA